MVDASQTFKDSMRESVKNGVGAIVTVAEENASYSSGDSLQSVVIKSTGYYYGVCTRSATIKLLGTRYHLVGKTLKIEQTALTDPTENVWEHIVQGIFVVQAQETDLEKDCTTVTAYDTMGCLGKTEYKTTDGIAFPCTVDGLAGQIAQHFGLTLDVNFAMLPNYNYMIKEDLYASISGITYRDILAEVAGAMAAIAIVTPDKRLVFRPLARSTQETWTYKDMIKFKIEPKYGEVNAVVLARTPQEDNIALRDEESVENNGLTEVKLANNEILDDDRQSLVKPLLDASKGFYFYPASVTTTGHGWHEIGDRIGIQDDEDHTYETIITDITLTLDGGIKENIVGAAPVETQTNYAMAGGIAKTIYNTEIKVDKQHQQIESIVSKQEELAGTVTDNHTTVTQTISSVVTSVQNSGGNNLIKNSAFYFRESNGGYTNWEILGDGALVVTPSESANIHSSLSGQLIKLTNKAVKQAVSVKANSANDDAETTNYTFSCRIYKAASGTGTVLLSDGVGEWKVELPNGERSAYKEYAIEKISPSTPVLTISVYGSDESDFGITDMMLAPGEFRSQWTQANGELANAQLQIDINGVKVSSPTANDTNSQLTSQGIFTKSGSSIISALTNGGLETLEISASKAINMPPLKIIPQRDGWAFVPEK